MPETSPQLTMRTREKPRTYPEGLTMRWADCSQREDSQHPKTPRFCITLSVTAFCGFWGPYESKRPPCCEICRDPGQGAGSVGRAGTDGRTCQACSSAVQPVVGQPAFASPGQGRRGHGVCARKSRSAYREVGGRDGVRSCPGGGRGSCLIRSGGACLWTRGGNSSSHLAWLHYLNILWWLSAALASWAAMDERNALTCNLYVVAPGERRGRKVSTPGCLLLVVRTQPHMETGALAWALS